MSEQGFWLNGSLLKPDIQAPTEKCHWWSKRVHCWHQTTCRHSYHGTGTVGSCLHRKCCWCSREERSELQVVGHGIHLEDKKDQTLNWTEWSVYDRPY